MIDRAIHMTTQVLDNNIIKIRTNERPDRLQNIVNKYRTNGLTAVADFLLTKARKSKRTSMTFLYGLEHLNRFIESNYKGYNLCSITERIEKKEVDVYKLLNEFVNYLQNDTKNGRDLSPATLNSYMTATRSFFQYNDIEISPSKFKYKVSLPTIYHEDEEAINSTDIKNILNHCSNRRLKAYLLVLAKIYIKYTFRILYIYQLRNCYL